MGSLSALVLKLPLKIFPVIADQAVLEDIRRNAKLFSEDAEKAAQRLMELKCADQRKQTATMKRDLTSAKKRLADLDVRLKRT